MSAFAFSLLSRLIRVSSMKIVNVPRESYADRDQAESIRKEDRETGVYIHIEGVDFSYKDGRTYMRMHRWRSISSSIYRCILIYLMLKKIKYIFLNLDIGYFLKM